MSQEIKNNSSTKEHDWREKWLEQIYDFWGFARLQAYAGGGEYKINRSLSGYKVFTHRERSLVLRFRDQYTDNPDTPGKFSGFEIIRTLPSGKIYFTYMYGGGLTNKGLEIGENVVYSKLRTFLRNNIWTARFGNNINTVSDDEYGKWEFINNGEKRDWGWKDEEILNLDGTPIHEVIGSGQNFIPYNFYRDL